MPRKGQRFDKPVIGNPDDPDGLAAYLLRFLEWMRIKNYSERTVTNRELYLGYFIQWCEQRGLERPNEITKPILERYQSYLYHYRKKRDGEPLSFRSQHTRLVPVRAFFKWLARNNYILYNPASELELPRLEKRLPRHVLTQKEADQVINQADINDPIGIRDRAILETLYSTGIRRMEIIHVEIYDLDTDRGTLMIRQGKGKKDRMVPIGKRAIHWIQKYLADVRPTLTISTHEVTLFLTNLGEPFTANRMTQMARDYVNASEIGKKGACHLFRHTMATLMLENGADIRFIQEMLGHASVETTQIYTQVSIRMLKQIHQATHPGAELEARTEKGILSENDLVNNLVNTLETEAEEENEYA